VAVSAKYARAMSFSLAILLTAASALAAPDPAAVLRMLQSTVEFHEVALSRDGARVAWVEQVPTPDGMVHRGKSRSSRWPT